MSLLPHYFQQSNNPAKDSCSLECQIKKKKGKPSDFIGI